VSLAAGAVAFTLLHRLSVLRLDRDAAFRTVLLLAVAPMSLFLGVVYNESLFLALAVGCFLAAERGRLGWAAALAGLKKKLEEETMEKVFEIYIKTTPERLWEAITNPEMRQKYTFGVRVESDWRPGSRYEGSAGSGTVSPSMKIMEGENLEVDPPRRLVQSFRALWSDDVKREGTSRVTWEIERVGDSCRLTVTHDQLREGANGELYGGWPMILSGLKTLLETGQLLTTPGSLRYKSAASWRATT
jgi:uncharacterized protein YndB with AHSA1/START domain